MDAQKWRGGALPRLATIGGNTTMSEQSRTAVSALALIAVLVVFDQVFLSAFAPDLMPALQSKIGGLHASLIESIRQLCW